ncbi:MAG: hypothetical protein HQL13_05675 [Candidatus Omnitrophica bacterium]|nr:hypothetical protein [Candidatus Omnitrophota bacterium]
MIPVSLGQTAMGRDLLAQDYMLKQLTASLIYPQKDLGKIFWDKVYAKAKEIYGTTQIQVNTFNKVWIVPQKASIYEHNQTAFIVSGHLNVMLEEDYLAQQKHQAHPDGRLSSNLASQIIRSIILPEIEKEINEGQNFATLRQIFYAQALAVWFKKNLKQALFNQVYANKGTVKGIDQNDASTNEAIYQQYLKAYKKGVFNFIQEDKDLVSRETLPRKYFSGGWNGAMTADVMVRVNRQNALVALGAAIGGPIGSATGAALVNHLMEIKVLALPNRTIPGGIDNRAFNPAMIVVIDKTARPIYLLESFENSRTFEIWYNTIEGKAGSTRVTISRFFEKGSQYQTGWTLTQGVKEQTYHFNGPDTQEQPGINIDGQLQIGIKLPGIAEGAFELWSLNSYRNFNIKQADTPIEDASSRLEEKGPSVVIVPPKQILKEPVSILELDNWVKNILKSKANIEKIEQLVRYTRLELLSVGSSNFQLKKEDIDAIEGALERIGLSLSKDDSISLEAPLIRIIFNPTLRTALLRGGYQTIGDLVSSTQQDLMTVKGIGSTFALIIEQRLNRKGFTLKGRPWKEQPPVTPNTSLKTLGIRGNLVDRLASEGGIYTAGDLERKSREDLLKFNGFGEKAVNELIAELCFYGYSLKDAAMSILISDSNYLNSFDEVHAVHRVFSKALESESDKISSDKKADTEAIRKLTDFLGILSKSFDSLQEAAKLWSQNKPLVDRLRSLYKACDTLYSLADDLIQVKVLDEGIKNRLSKQLNSIVVSLNVYFLRSILLREGELRVYRYNQYGLISNLGSSNTKSLRLVKNNKRLSVVEDKDAVVHENARKAIEEYNDSTYSFRPVESELTLQADLGNTPWDWDQAVQIPSAKQQRAIPPVDPISYAMTAGRAMNAAIPTGGIDLSQQDSAMHVTKDANGGVKVTVDKGLIAEIEHEGAMRRVTPVIIYMGPADSKALFGVAV